MSHILAAIIAAIIAATAATVVAVVVITGSVKGGHHSNGQTSVAVPGPVAGVGLPAIALVGGYLWLVRRKKR